MWWAPPPTHPHCPYLVYQPHLQNRVRTQSLLTPPTSPHHSHLHLWHPFSNSDLSSAQEQQAFPKVFEVLVLLCLEPSSLPRSLREKGSFYSGLQGSAGSSALPSQHGLSIGIPKPCPLAMGFLAIVIHSMSQLLGPSICFLPLPGMFMSWLHDLFQYFIQTFIQFCRTALIHFNQNRNPLVSCLSQARSSANTSHHLTLHSCLWSVSIH